MHRWNGKEAIRKVGGRGFESSQPRTHVKRLVTRDFACAGLLGVRNIFSLFFGRETRIERD
jgi:hypothetical protein